LQLWVDIRMKLETVAELKSLTLVVSIEESEFKITLKQTLSE